jgi:hypothetical protein
MENFLCCWRIALWISMSSLTAMSIDPVGARTKVLSGFSRCLDFDHEKQRLLSRSLALARCQARPVQHSVNVEKMADQISFSLD